jgi:hypothetical protein
MVTTRQERERLVLDLYNQGKNTREIAEDARMSFSAIGVSLKYFAACTGSCQVTDLFGKII